MLSLEVQISKRTNRWVDVTNDFLNITSRNYLSGCKYWRTMKGVENFIDKAIKTYPWLTRGKTSESTAPKRNAASHRPPPPTWKCMWGTCSSAFGATA